MIYSEKTRKVYFRMRNVDYLKKAPKSYQRVYIIRERKAQRIAGLSRSKRKGSDDPPPQVQPKGRVNLSSANKVIRKPD